MLNVQRLDDFVVKRQTSSNKRRCGWRNKRRCRWRNGVAACLDRKEHRRVSPNQLKNIETSFCGSNHISQTAELQWITMVQDLTQYSIFWHSSNAGHHYLQRTNRWRSYFSEFACVLATGALLGLKRTLGATYSNWKVRYYFCILQILRICCWFFCSQSSICHKTMVTNNIIP